MATRKSVMAGSGAANADLPIKYISRTSINPKRISFPFICHPWLVFYKKVESLFKTGKPATRWVPWRPSQLLHKFDFIGFASLITEPQLQIFLHRQNDYSHITSEKESRDMVKHLRKTASCNASWTPSELLSHHGSRTVLSFISAVYSRRVNLMSVW